MSKMILACMGVTALGFTLDHIVSDRKLFGGTTPKTMSKEWQVETERMKNAWPRTAGPSVVLNPITRQNFIIKSHDS
ncbi:unnamed protein product [Lactuca virosa]|uniref:Uncharacterized protein n=1 Tax=Lactuca virosa TaxID=75947 RepID=A0AAU9PTQ4_9ASTR|nr:unnamed protein product [Lactuca virosa]